MKASFKKENFGKGLKETIAGFLLIGAGVYHLLFNGGDYVSSSALIVFGGIALGLKLEK